jgi:glyoxylase-like metal-dependent hydrolase (beta-lactamase superfamily II)
MSNTIATETTSGFVANAKANYPVVFSHGKPVTSIRMRALFALRSALRMLVTLLALVSIAASPSHAQETAVSQLPGVYRFMVGDIPVTALSDGTVPIDLHQLLRGIASKRTDALLAKNFLRNPYEASINVFLLELGGRHVLVDTGAGELFGPGNGGKLPQALLAAGVRPEDITDILITHVHSDHSGGLVVGGRMTFPNATIHVGKADVDFFLDKANAAGTGYDKRYFDEAAATLKPYVDAGKVQAFDRRGEVLPGVVAELRPGHTPGTAFYTLTSRGTRLVFIGDIIHVGAIQFAAPAVTITFDQDQSKARAVRQEAFAEFAQEQTLIAAPHLQFPGIGRIRPDGDGYRWVALPYVNRSVGARAQDLGPNPTTSSGAQTATGRQ